MKKIAFLGWVLNDWRLDFLKRFLRLNSLTYLIIVDNHQSFDSLDANKLCNLDEFLGKPTSNFMLIELPADALSNDSLSGILNSHGFKIFKLNDFYKYSISEGFNILPFDSISYNEYTVIIKKKGRYQKHIFCDEESYKIASDLLMIFRGYMWERFYSYTQEETVEQCFLSFFSSPNLIDDSRCLVLIGEKDQEITYLLNQIVNLKAKFFDRRVFFTDSSDQKFFEEHELKDLLINDYIVNSGSFSNTYVSISSDELLPAILANFPDNFILFANKSLVDFERVFIAIGDKYRFKLRQPNSDPSSLLIFGEKMNGQ